MDQPTDRPPALAQPAAPPIACSLSPGEMQQRGREIEALAREALVDGERGERSVRLRYRRSDAVQAALLDLVRRESACCPFLSFAVREDETLLTLDISGPPEAAAVLDAICERSRAR
jgi:hypothetical protein